MNSLIGYHGTTQENANKILEEKHFKESTKDNEWLGRGVYFFAFRDSAAWWIQADRYRNQDTAILKVILKYNDEHFLELDDPAQLRQFNKIVKDITSRSKGVKNLYLKQKKNAKVWCFACNLIKQIEPDIGMIAYTFQHKDYYPDIRLCSNHRQICVSKHEIITDIQQEKNNQKVLNKDVLNKVNDILEIEGGGDIC